MRLERKRTRGEHAQCASALLMVAPHDFEFNEETSFDNEFQTRPTQSPAQVNLSAMEEFNAMVDTLRHHFLTVLVPERRTKGPRTPDAVFPNNWFATGHDGTVLLFPMAPPGRRLEKRVDAVEHVLDQNGFLVRNILNVGRYYETQHFLEGTGCMVIDHTHRRIFAARSERCHAEQLDNFAQIGDYRTQVFSTCSSTGKAIYHTNVMMSIGEDFAVVCSESIIDADERRHVLGSLREHREIIDISLQQVEMHMCGNILQVRNTRNQSLIVMSQRALAGFSDQQIKTLQQFGEILSVRLDTIERVGGGSARCMMAEVFLPRQGAPINP